MSFFVQQTMPHQAHKLIISANVWRELVSRLRISGGHGEHESGAFLLGTRVNTQSCVAGFIPYDDLDPHCLDTGIVRFDGRYYGELWKRCQQQNVAVVADVHTHPFGSQQSPSDRNHPMISSAGHIALILPRFAQGEFALSDVGMYLYLGAKRWYIVPICDRKNFLTIQT